eukprot:TRINITY_DN26338_c0_g1_i1.p2 TRINITY_DN26338_c0_g1~~TRINITY_DN26338_c0_g1_i1.p2  ORF type:complete len:221 (+),score=51.58 TRINITY_DN26338_c0_g1_i1:1006-1668(+)
MSGKPRVLVNITSDILCPWCWVGKRSLDAAVAATGKDVAIMWHPYFLHKDVPAEGVDKLQHYKQRFGKANALKLLTDKDSEVQVAGKGLGLELNWKKGTILSNAVKGHRLLWYVLDNHGHAKQHELMDALFYRYFTLNKDIGSNDVLIEAATTVGIPSAPLPAFLDSPAYTDEVLAYHQQNTPRGVTSIPHFEFSHEGDPTPYKVCGGQSIEDFKKIITA